MNEHTVRVTYDPNATPPFKFEPDRIVMAHGPGAVVLQRAGNPGWSFVSADVKDDKHNEFSPEAPSGGGATIVIRNRNTHRDPHGYRVTIRPSGGQPVTSPDPEIQNTGPEMVLTAQSNYVTLAVAGAVGAAVAVAVVASTGLVNRSLATALLVGAVVGAIAGVLAGLAFRTLFRGAPGPPR